MTQLFYLAGLAAFDNLKGRMKASLAECSAQLGLTHRPAMIHLVQHVYCEAREGAL